MFEYICYNPLVNEEGGERNIWDGKSDDIDTLIHGSWLQLKYHFHHSVNDVCNDDDDGHGK